MFWHVIPAASLRTLAVRLGQSGSSALPSLVVVSRCALEPVVFNCPSQKLRNLLSYRCGKSRVHLGSARTQLMILYYIRWVMLPILLTCCASAYLTTLLCRFAEGRGRRVWWVFGFLATAAAGVLTVLFIWLGVSLQHGANGVNDEVGFCVSVFIRVSVPALVPALFVIWYYRRRIRNAASTFVDSGRR